MIISNKNIISKRSRFMDQVYYSNNIDKYRLTIKYGFIRKNKDIKFYITSDVEINVGYNNWLYLQKDSVDYFTINIHCHKLFALTRWNDCYIDGLSDEYPIIHMLYNKLGEESIDIDKAFKKAIIWGSLSGDTDEYWGWLIHQPKDNFIKILNDRKSDLEKQFRIELDKLGIQLPVQN